MRDHPFSRGELVTQLRTLGVRGGGVLLVHTSFRAVRPVVDGPRGLIQALQEALGPDGTLVMPSWTGDDDEPFDPRSTAAAEDLGVLPETFWRMPGVLRSGHAQAFAAAGPHAEDILQDPLPLPPHIPDSPVGRVLKQNGQILLLGVGHEADTMIHLAEILSGVSYGVPRHCTILEDGVRRRIDYIEADCCGERFALLDEWLRADGKQVEGPVGNAFARLVRAEDVVEAVVRRLTADPLLFLHPAGHGCPDCDQARHGRGHA